MFSRQKAGTFATFDEGLSFKVMRVNPHDDVLVRATSLLIERASYETARRLFRSDRIRYRNGRNVLDPRLTSAGTTPMGR